MSSKLGVAVFGAGYVGSNLFKTLQVLDKSEQFLINREMIDYTNELKLRSFIETCKPNVIVNCVGFTGKPNVDACELNKADTYKLNVQLPVLMAKLCEQYNIDFFHISSGCIYSGYEKKYNEKDEPDFGVYNPKSSFYSMTKHAAELNLASFAKTKILRIRMPFCGERNQRNYLMKIRNYDNLLNATNSKTHIPSFCDVLSSLITNKENYMPKYTLNVCNPEPLSTPEIIDIYKKHGFENPNWKLIKYEELPIKANRSNCIMDTTKLTKDFNFSFPTEAEAIIKSIVSLRDNA